MKSWSSEIALLPSLSDRTAIDSTACNVGSRWMASVGALACAVTQIMHGEELRAAASEWLCTASAPAMNMSRTTQLSATMRIAGFTPV